MYSFIKIVQFLYLDIEHTHIYIYISIPINNFLILFQEHLQGWPGGGMTPYDFS